MCSMLRPCDGPMFECTVGLSRFLLNQTNTIRIHSIRLLAFPVIAGGICSHVRGAHPTTLVSHGAVAFPHRQACPAPSGSRVQSRPDRRELLLSYVQLASTVRSWTLQ